LIGSFPQVLDVGFTAMMESQLDEVEEGKVDWIELLKSFYQPFAKRLEVAKEGMRNLKAETVPTEHVCEKCGSPMIIRWGRNGQFLACSGYPNCKNAKPFRMTEDGRVEIVEDEVTDRKCPNCGRAMVIKSGRRGRFLACSGYPECKTSQPLPIGVPCPRPGCTGELVERRSNKGGKVFYSCSAYPECRFLVGQLPRLEKCETCGKERHMVGQPPKQKAFGCSEPNCPYLPAYDPSKATDDDDSGKPRRRGARRDAQSGGATDDDAVAETG
jgi:DNA topoisomerase-1